MLVWEQTFSGAVCCNKSNMCFFLQWWGNVGGPKFETRTWVVWFCGKHSKLASHSIIHIIVPDSPVATCSTQGLSNSWLSTHVHAIFRMVHSLRKPPIEYLKCYGVPWMFLFPSNQPLFWLVTWLSSHDFSHVFTYGGFQKRGYPKMDSL